jgi:hypothetical protein
MLSYRLTMWLTLTWQSSVIFILGSITDWVVESPVAALPLSTLGEVFCLVWKLFIASLCIPWAQSEFDALCSDPSALQKVAGLVLTSLIDVSSCQHLCSNRQQA